MAGNPKHDPSPAFPFYARDFLSSSKVMGMSMAERGLYITLLAISWLDGPLPKDVDKLGSSLTHNGKRFRTWWNRSVSQCFTPVEGGLVNRRLERERAKQVQYRELQAMHGRKGGRVAKGQPPPSLSQAQASGSVNSSKPQAKKSFSTSTSTSVRTEEVPGRAVRTPEVHARARATPPIGTSRPSRSIHAAHVFCGRVCVPADLHADFVRLLNDPQGDVTLPAWYEHVDAAWKTGAHRHDKVGTDPFAFWKARFNEDWGTDPRPRRETVGTHNARMLARLRGQES